jgi:hypothetical protein
VEEASNELPGRFRLLIDRLLQHLRGLDRQVRELERKVEQWHRSSTARKRLETIPGIGPITASALVASAGDPSSFRNARQFAAWIRCQSTRSARAGSHCEPRPEALIITTTGQARQEHSHPGLHGRLQQLARLHAQHTPSTDLRAGLTAKRNDSTSAYGVDSYAVAQSQRPTIVLGRIVSRSIARSSSFRQRRSIPLS